MQYVGWISSGILSITIAYQVYTQWKSEKSEGVSTELFIGQFAANSGFIAYSYSIENWVFVFTNSLLVITNVLGFFITLKHKRST